MATTPKIKITLLRSNGHRSTAETRATHPPSPEMIKAAEELIQFLSTGVKP